MKNKKSILILALAILTASMIFVTGCVTTSIGGTTDPQGLISQAGVVIEGAQEIASYTVVLGLFNLGYPEYAEAVMAAEAAGKRITSVSTFWYLFTITKAYAK